MNAIAPNLTVRPRAARPALPARMSPSRALAALPPARSCLMLLYAPASRRCQVMVGELVGARLIAHAGSLMNLAKHPASTVQILGAEKRSSARSRPSTTRPNTGSYTTRRSSVKPRRSTRGGYRACSPRRPRSRSASASARRRGATIAYENRRKSTPAGPARRRRRQTARRRSTPRPNTRTRRAKRRRRRARRKSSPKGEPRIGPRAAPRSTPAGCF